MADIQAREMLKDLKRVVVKVGTKVLSGSGDTLDEAYVGSLCGQVAGLRGDGKEVIVVSSGAIGAGVGQLGLARRPTKLAEVQAAAAIGQGLLIRAYQRALAQLGLAGAQVLLTADDLDDRTRYLNARNTLMALLAWGAVPIVNENDTVSTEEIGGTSFGDNDRLAALVANLAHADVLVILTTVDGVYEQDSGGSRRHIDVVARVTPEIRALARTEQTKMGTGGMAAKLEAAAIATRSGQPVVIANGRTPDVLRRILGGEPIGTLFVPQKRRLASRKHWLGFSARPRGVITVDDGAAKAIRQHGRSLLSSGVTGVAGRFARGDTVAVVDSGGVQFARGLANYNADEVRRIKGAKSSQIRKILGSKPYDEIVHRDNMVVLDG